MTSTATPTSHAARPRRDLGRALVQGAIGGLLAGVVFIGVTMWFAASMGNPATQPFLLISTIVLGADAMAAGTASVGVGVLVHAVLSALFGVIFALISPVFRTNGTIALAGGLYGGLLYVVNFLVLGNTLLPQFLAGPNQPFELVVHLVYGHLLAVFVYSLGPRRGEPPLAFARPGRAATA